jgi:hypothetical protein
MSHKIHQFFVFAAFTISFGSTAFAGQISVINPSAGTEITGVVTITPNAPAGATSVTNPQGQTSNLSTNFGTNGYLPPRMARIVDHLMQTDLGRFSVNEQEELIELITGLMSSERLSSETRNVLRYQIQRLQALR